MASNHNDDEILNVGPRWCQRSVKDRLLKQCITTQRLSLGVGIVSNAVNRITFYLYTRVTDVIHNKPKGRCLLWLIYVNYHSNESESSTK